MPAAPLPLNEEERLLALERYAILDTLPEQQYDDLTFLAGHICETPIALISIVEQGRQWFKSKVGIDICETSRDVSFCAHALHSRSVMEVADTHHDARFSDNPLVTGEPHIRFYAGAPLVTTEGFILGTLCVADFAPRHLTEKQKRGLEGLARQVVSQMELWRSVKRFEIASVERSIALEVAHTNTRRLQASENRFRQFMDNSPVVAFIKDATGRYVYSNSLMRQTFGLEESDIIGHNDFEWLPSEVAEVLSLNDRRVLESGETAQLLEDVPTPNGQMCNWLSFKFVIQDNDNGSLLGGVSLDITEMLRIQRMKNEFVSVVSHELRTPLTSIRGSLGLLLGGVAGEMQPRVHDMVGIAHKNTERLMLLINDILDIEKIESGKMRFHMAPVRLQNLLRSAAETSTPYAQALGTSLKLEPLSTDLENLWLCGDEGRLMQILANLLSNAAKFTPANGEVRLRARRVVQDRVRIEIQDEGEGVPEAFVPRLFERFAQADVTSTRQQGGTGLGLAIARALVEKHGGEIGYVPPNSTRRGKGATFFFQMQCFPSDADLPCSEETLDHLA